MAILSEIAGKVSIEEVKNNKVVTVTNDNELDQNSYVIPFGARLKVNDGDVIEKGDALTEGWANPHDIYNILGVEAVQNYIIKEVQRAYRMHGVDINDKHIEVIVRQMMKKIRIEDPGSTSLLLNKIVDKAELDAENAAVRARMEAGEEGLRFATGIQTLLGITKASLATDSVPVRGVFPGDDPRSDGSGDLRQDRPADRPEGKRHYRQTHPGRHGPGAVPQRGNRRK